MSPPISSRNISVLIPFSTRDIATYFTPRTDSICIGTSVSTPSSVVISSLPKVNTGTGTVLYDTCKVEIVILPYISSAFTLKPLSPSLYSINSSYSYVLSPFSISPPFDVCPSTETKNLSTFFKPASETILKVVRGITGFSSISSYTISSGSNVMTGRAITSVTAIGKVPLVT